jgi:chorismate mutase
MGEPWSDDPLVRELRERISAGDRTILRLVNERLELVERLHAHKARQGYPMIDRGREDALVAALAEENHGPLSAEGLERLFRTLIEITKREVGARVPR